MAELDFQRQRIPLWMPILVVLFGFGIPIVVSAVILSAPRVWPEWLGGVWAQKVLLTAAWVRCFGPAMPEVLRALRDFHQHPYVNYAIAEDGTAIFEDGEEEPDA